MQVKGYSWVGVGTDDFKETVSFFTDVLSLSAVVIEDRGVAMLKVAEGQILEVFGPGTKGGEFTSAPVVAFEVDDVAAAREELITRGVEILGEIGSWNGFEWLKFRGPGGRSMPCRKRRPRDGRRQPSRAQSAGAHMTSGLLKGVPAPANAGLHREQRETAVRRAKNPRACAPVHTA